MKNLTYKDVLIALIRGQKGSFWTQSRKDEVIRNVKAVALKGEDRGNRKLNRPFNAYRVENEEWYMATISSCIVWSATSQGHSYWERLDCEYNSWAIPVFVPQTKFEAMVEAMKEHKCFSEGDVKWYTGILNTVRNNYPNDLDSPAGAFPGKLEACFDFGSNHQSPKFWWWLVDKLNSPSVELAYLFGEKI